jgi:uncharacterized membrane protein YfcA
MEVTTLSATTSIVSGGIVGFTLGLIGGGGSVLAVPLLLYVVGMRDTHMALGTSATAVAVSALVNLAVYARRGAVQWSCAGVFAGGGVIGAIAGARLAQAIDGRVLLLAFAAAMVAIAVAMFRRRHDTALRGCALDWPLAAKLLPVGFVTGLASGFFGIGGGFLIVPGLIFASGMSLNYAIGSSLFAVWAFGTATAATYAVVSLVNWPIALLFVLGGFLGGLAGARLGRRLARGPGLSMAFSAVLLLVAVYVAFRAIEAL